MLNSKARILIVDDEKDNLNALKRLLRGQFEVEVASSGPEALKILDQSKAFDCILSDQRMPGMSGSELFERIRDLIPNATRILISGFSDLEAVIEAVNRGQIWKYVSKPWEPQELIETLKNASERARLLSHLEASRLQLQRAALELRAKDWARERLLQILLHEFRSLPHILDNVLELNRESEHTEDRERFLKRAQERMNFLKTDLETLIADEKELSKLDQQPLALFDFLKSVLAHSNVNLETPQHDLTFTASESTLSKGLSHLLNLFQSNQAQAPLSAQLELTSEEAPNTIFLTLSAASETPIYPAFVKQEKIDPQLAWQVALEPFVGHQDILLHSQGLRIETASHIRRLSSQGVRVEFNSEDSGRSVHMTFAFNLRP